MTLVGCSQGFTGPSGAVTDTHWGYNPQQYLNINQALVDTNKDGEFDMVFTGGKKGANIDISLEIDEEGNITSVQYNADELEAIVPGDVRAAVEIAVAEQNGLTVREITPELRGVIESIVDKILAQ